MANNIRLGARLRASRKAAGFKTSKSFLNKYKFPASTYSQHESGSRSPDDSTLKFYSKVFGVSFDWLKTGKGQPFINKPLATKKIAMKEELLDINEQKHEKARPFPYFDQKLFCKILQNLLEAHISPKIKIPTTTIVQDAISGYMFISDNKNTKKNKLQMLKDFLASYKKKNL